ncbi:adenylate kinase 8 [Aspergillus udagawae]|uniref:Adenylate kinase 8 n=1 Tax=Aspergillus udagawae TaxID=91492 RepID=A0ABQ1BBG8_9EURO|nr:adenylate kinase 8 [Aspergillus udagawae]GFF97797.1 adenylate kinase 8 [Aspergillus udagawae]GFG14995.1 adenylate kinase 8 [Aspergillus udagawae]GFG27431.1 adenylate kinase 8 [Aspergillus udagawae]
MSDTIEEIHGIEEPAQSQSEKNDIPLAKRTCVQRVEHPLPELASKNGDTWTHDEESYLRGGILIPVEVPNDAAPSDDVDVKSAKLILLFGPPAAGKSTAAANVAAELGSIHICPDQTIRRLGETGPYLAWLAVVQAIETQGTVPSELLFRLVKMEIQRHMEFGATTFIIDGWPHCSEDFTLLHETFTVVSAFHLYATQDTLEKRAMQNPMTFDEGTKRLKSFRDGMVRYYQELGDLLTLDSFKDVLIPMSAEQDYQVFYPQIKLIIEKRLARVEAASELAQTETSSDEHEHEHEPVVDENLE